ncbi:MAG: hypothetical protein IH891_02060 [Planctomycetes bacterium]|nr:hypothetical protein [Planctomycetota bacterium]
MCWDRLIELETAITVEVTQPRRTPHVTPARELSAPPEPSHEPVHEDVPVLAQAS